MPQPNNLLYGRRQPRQQSWPAAVEGLLEGNRLNNQEVFDLVDSLSQAQQLQLEAQLGPAEAGRLAAARLGYQSVDLPEGALNIFQKALGQEMINLYDQTISIDEQQFADEVVKLGGMSVFDRAAQICQTLYRSDIVPDKSQVDPLLTVEEGQDIGPWLRNHFRATPRDFQRWLGGLNFDNCYVDIYQDQGRRGASMRDHFMRQLSYELPHNLDKSFNQDLLRAAVQKALLTSAGLAKSLSVMENIDRRERKRTRLIFATFTPLALLTLTVRLTGLLSGWAWVGIWIAVIWSGSLLLVLNYRNSMRALDRL